MSIILISAIHNLQHFVPVDFDHRLASEYIQNDDRIIAAQITLHCFGRKIDFLLIEQIERSERSGI